MKKVFVSIVDTIFKPFKLKMWRIFNKNSKENSFEMFGNILFTSHSIQLRSPYAPKSEATPNKKEPGPQRLPEIQITIIHLFLMDGVEFEDI
mgnify:CR=1 FL=1